MSAPLPADPYENGLRLSGQNRHGEAIEQFERALAATPDDSRVLFALGNTARALGLAKPAEEFYRRVLAQEPARLEALVSLANLLRAQGQLPAAEALLAPALARAPEAPELWLTLGSTYREMGDFARAAEHYRQALTRRPDYPPALVNLADLLADDGDVDAALALYGRAIAREPDNAQARLNRAILHLLKGNLKEGWRDYAARLKVPGKASVPEHKLSRWNGGSLKRTRLLITAEQGVGDQIMFASMIPDLAARARARWRVGPARMRAAAGRPVRAVLSRRDGAWLGYGGRAAASRGRAMAGLKQTGGANAFIEMGSVAKVLRGRMDDFPDDTAFLRPDPLTMAQFGGILASVGPGPHIGVCWRSGNVAGHRALQYAPREAWAAFIAKLPGTVVSVQYDAGNDEIDALADMSGRPIVVLEGLDQKNEIDRTSALLASLDAVVSAPTAVSWLAAATGVDTYKILYDTSWTALGGLREPFAPACELMMPASRGDWTGAFERTLERITATL
ncbi:MAG: tetratricopeptide repeat protein [Rhizomicrobium sp.]